MKIDNKLSEWRRKYKGYYILRLGWISKNKKKEMEEWLGKNCSFDWSLHFSIIKGYCAFLDEIDAMAFKLRWL